MTYVFTALVGFAHIAAISRSGNSIDDFLVFISHRLALNLKKTLFEGRQVFWVMRLYLPSSDDLRNVSV